MDNIYNEFILVLKKYSYHFYKNMLIRYKHNTNYFEFIYLKGIFLIKNVFNFLYFNSANMNEIISISEQAYIYFIEFLIQININSINSVNSVNFELTLKDALMFTYKKTILSYNKGTITSTIKCTINSNLDSNLDNNLNILSNIFYIINNINIIECSFKDQQNDEIFSNALLTNKIYNIELLEKKILKFINNNKDIIGFNQTILNIRDKMETHINSSLITQNNGSTKNKKNNIAIINYIHKILDNVEHNNTLLECAITSLDLY